MPKVCKAVIAANGGFFAESKVWRTQLLFKLKIIIYNLVNALTIFPCHKSPWYCCSFCSPIPEVQVTGLLGCTELSLRTPGSSSSLIVFVEMCPLVPRWAVDYSSHVRWSCEYLCGGSACAVSFVHCILRVSFFEVYPCFFVWVHPSVLYVYFVCIKNPDVFLRLSPNPLHQRDVPIHFAINFMYVFMGKRGHF